jgi:acyl-CoA thioester hydrolase
MDIVLTPTIRAEFGVDGDWSLALRHRVRWSEVDAYAHVNHAAYLEWYEDARIRTVQALGLPMGLDRPGPVMAKIDIEYPRPLGYGADVLITARAASFRRTSFVMDYATWQQGLVNRARAVLVLFVNSTGEKVPIPEGVRRRMVERDRAVAE